MRKTNREKGYYFVTWAFAFYFTLSAESIVICTVGTRLTVVHICHGKTYFNVAYKVMIQRPKVLSTLYMLPLVFVAKPLVFVPKHLVTNATLSAETTLHPLLFAKTC